MIGLLGIAVLWKYQAWIISGILVWLAYKAIERLELWSLYRAWRECKIAKRHADEAERELLLARADYENRMWQQAGIYEGDYAGVTMPMTFDFFPGKRFPPKDYPQDWGLDDYDDGMSEWQTERDMK